MTGAASAAAAPAPAPADAGDGLLRLEGVHKYYGEGDARLHVLHDINLRVREGEFVAIVGQSGSGKSTLLNILGCLDRPSQGAYVLDGRDTARLGDDDLSEVRSRAIGFVFQSFQLIPQLTVLENVEVPLLYAGFPRTERHRIARERLDQVGLASRLEHRPTQLSGGEQQRVALARALVTRPHVLLADEPTGNLDGTTGTHVMDLLFSAQARRNTTLILVTHDEKLASRCSRVVRMADGHIVSASAEQVPA